MPPRRVLLVSAALALCCGGLIWNLVFDLWLGQVERQYLLEQTRAQFGVAPRVSLEAVMAQAIHDAAWIATAWTLLVVLSIVGVAVYAFRQGRQGQQSLAAPSAPAAAPPSAPAVPSAPSEETRPRSL